jgi:hypothetical protein
MPNYYLQKLTAVVALDGHRLTVTFEDGYTATIDMTWWISRTPGREALRDPAVFGAVKVNEFGAPEWPDEIDLSPGALRAWCEAGYVMSRGTTDEWIHEHSEKTQGVA